MTTDIIAAESSIDNPDFLVIRINRVWMDRVKGRIKVFITVLLMLGGGTTWSSVQSLFAVWSTQAGLTESHELTQVTNSRAEGILDMQLADWDDRCTKYGYIRPGIHGPVQP